MNATLSYLSYSRSCFSVKTKVVNRARSLYQGIRYSGSNCKDDRQSQQSLVPASTPPYAVRALLVCSTVGLSTVGLASPIFGVPDICPFLMHNSDLVLPFAVANGISAAFWFSAGELLDRLAGRTTKVSTEVPTEAPTEALTVAPTEVPTELPTEMPTEVPTEIPTEAVEMPALNASIMTHPKTIRSGNGIHLAAGPLIGGLTAVTSPLLWPYLFSNLWPVDLREMVLGTDPYWISHMYEFIVFPVALPVGELSGLMMQWSLKPLVYGAPHIPWKARSLPALLAILGACVFYFTIFHQPADSMFWIKRLNPSTGSHRSYNACTQQVIEDDGAKASAEAWKRNSIKNFASIPKRGCHPEIVGTWDDDKATQKEKSNQTKLIAENVTISSLPKYQAIYCMIDILVYVKCLQMNKLTLHSNSNSLPWDSRTKTDSANRYKENQNQLNSMIRGEISTLLPLLQDFELAIRTTRKMNRTDAADGNIETEIVELGLHRRESIARILKSADIPEEENIAADMAVRLVVQNIDILEEELWRELKYTVEEEIEVEILLIGPVYDI